MNSIKKIVCAIDLSPHSTTVAEYAISMVKAFDAEVTVIFVAPRFEPYMSFALKGETIEELTADVRATSNTELQKFVAANFVGVNATMKLLEGHPAEKIVDYAKEISADLIVMGTHGHRWVNRILFGSIAEGVIKNSRIPVLTIRPKE